MSCYPLYFTLHSNTSCVEHAWRCLAASFPGLPNIQFLIGYSMQDGGLGLGDQEPDGGKARERG